LPRKSGEPPLSGAERQRRYRQRLRQASPKPDIVVTPADRAVTAPVTRHVTAPPPVTITSRPAERDALPAWAWPILGLLGAAWFVAVLGGIFWVVHQATHH
jgi:hypothetical protein